MSAFFFYVVNILAFVNQPPFRTKSVIVGVFSIPAIAFLLLGTYFRGFRQVRRDTVVVLLSASAVAALVVLSTVCILASPETAKYFSPETLRFFSDITSGGS